MLGNRRIEQRLVGCVSETLPYRIDNALADGAQHLLVQRLTNPLRQSFCHPAQIESLGATLAFNKREAQIVCQATPDCLPNLFAHTLRKSLTRSLQHLAPYSLPQPLVCNVREPGAPGTIVAVSEILTCAKLLCPHATLAAERARRNLNGLMQLLKFWSSQ
jgi:hypothetical protein